MKIGLLTSWLTHRGGGVVDVVRRLAPSLQADPDLQVSVFGLRSGIADIEAEAWRGIPLTALPTLGPHAWGYAPRLASALRSADLDILHVHGIWMYPSMASLNWGCATARAHVVSPHGMLDAWALRHGRWKKRAAFWAFERRHLSRAACIHCLCEAEAEAIRTLGLRNAICIVPNGIAPAAPAGPARPAWHGLSGDDKVLLYLGRLHPKKGLRDLLLAWQCFEHRSDRAGGTWHLAIAGWSQSGYEDELKRLAQTLSIGASVRFLGPCFGVEKEALLRAATAFVLPSYSEGLPMAVLEAWAHGLPVVMTRHCNLPEGFRAGAALEAATDRDSIARSLETLSRMSEADRREMAQRGLQLCRERFSQGRASAMLASVYRWVLRLGPRPACVVTE